jgi:carbonic anhydrase
MKKLIRGLGEFKSNYFAAHQNLFIELAQGQKPRVLFITCANSRIAPNLITQAEVGELFIIRNAGNIIPPFGAANGGEGATVEYAIHSLGIENLKTYPVIHSRLYQDRLKIYGWIYYLETGEVLAYDPESHAYVAPTAQVPIDSADLIPAPVACALPTPVANPVSPDAEQTTVQATMLES